MATKTPELPFLSAAEILAVNDRTAEVLDVPEWGTRLRVQGLSGRERDQFQASLYSFGPTDKGGMRVTAINNNNVMARLVSLSVVDESGKRLFTEAQVVALGDKSAIALERVDKVARRLSGLETTTMEALTENLKETQNGSSGSNSPET